MVTSIELRDAKKSSATVDPLHAYQQQKSEEKQACYGNGGLWDPTINTGGGSVMAGDDWVHITIDDRFRLGPKGFARECGWELREDREGLRIALEENYFERTPRLISPHLLGVAPGKLIDDMVTARWQKHDPYIEEDRPLVEDQLRRLVATGSREDFWEAFGLAVKAVSDSEVPE